MLTSHDLDRLGKEISASYIEDDRPLTEALVKTASAHGLNRQQINRVAESANVETYLGLLKTSSDKYVNFNLADSRAAHEKVADQPVTKEGAYADYDSEPTKDDVSVFDLYREYHGEDSFKKEASVGRTENEARKEASQLLGTLEFLDDNMRESLACLETAFDKLAFYTKQELLSGTPFNNIKRVVTQAAPFAGEKIAEDMQNRFKPSLTHIDFEKSATYKGIPNPDNTIYKYAAQIEKEADQTYKVYNAVSHYDANYKSITDEANIPNLFKKAGFVGSVGRGIVDFYSKHAFLGGVTVGAGIAYGSGKEAGRKEQGSFLKNYSDDRKSTLNQPVFRRIK